MGLAAPVLLRASGQGALRQLQLLGNVGMDVEEGIGRGIKEDTTSLAILVLADLARGG